MHPLRKQPLLEFLILLAGMISIMLLIQGTNTWIALTTTKQTPAIAKKEASDLRLVQATACPYGPPDQLGSTQLPKFTASTASSDGINKIATIFDQATQVDVKIDFPNPGDQNAQPRLNTIVGRSDGLKFHKANGGEIYNSNISYGHIVEIPTTFGQEVKVPFAGRRILNGTNLFGLVFSIESDGVRIANSRNDKPTGAEGYNLYITGITVNPKLIERYNKGNSQFDRSCMPEMNIEDVLGTAKGTSIKVALRDNGKLLPLNSQLFWDSKGAVAMDIVGKDSKGVDVIQPANSQPPAAVPVAPAAPATSLSGGTVTALRTAVQRQTIYNSITIDIPTKDKLIPILIANITRNKILLIGDSNTYNPNFTITKTSITGAKDEMQKKVAGGGRGSSEALVELNKESSLAQYKYALILIGSKDTDTDTDTESEMVSTFKNNLEKMIDKLVGKEIGVIPIIQTISDFRDQGDRLGKISKINEAIIAVAKEKKVVYVDTRSYINAGHMTADKLHFNTKNYDQKYCGIGGSDCNPPLDDASDNKDSPISGFGIRNIILQEVITKLEGLVERNNRTVIFSSNASPITLKSLNLFGVQAQTAPESIISILQSYGSSGYLCYDFGGLSCVPATLSTIEGRAVRVDVTVDKSYPAKPICVSRTNSCNGGIFLDPNL